MTEDIEYGDYQGGNVVSFDNDMLKEWVKNINIDLSHDSINSQFGLMEVLLFEGEYMPFINRNGNKVFAGRDWTGFPEKYPTALDNSLNIKSGKNKIYLNNKDVTDKMKKRYDNFVYFCKRLEDSNETGSIWYYWKGGKL